MNLREVLKLNAFGAMKRRGLRAQDRQINYQQMQYRAFVSRTNAISRQNERLVTALEKLANKQAEPVQEPAIPWGKAIGGAEQKRGCQVCGIGADGRAMGYVCPRGDCPMKVTCGGVA